MPDKPTMDSKMFRKLAENGVDQICDFLDRFADEFYPVMRIGTRFGTVVIGIEKTPPDEEEP
jgi:hypothetical protein